MTKGCEDCNATFVAVDADDQSNANIIPDNTYFQFMVLQAVLFDAGSLIQSISFLFYVYFES